MKYRKRIDELTRTIEALCEQAYELRIENESYFIGVRNGRGERYVRTDITLFHLVSEDVPERWAREAGGFYFEVTPEEYKDFFILKCIRDVIPYADRIESIPGGTEFLESCCRERFRIYKKLGFDLGMPDHISFIDWEAIYEKIINNGNTRDLISFFSGGFPVSRD